VGLFPCNMDSSTAVGAFFSMQHGRVLLSVGAFFSMQHGFFYCIGAFFFPLQHGRVLLP
jgi:hypothetical protein